MRKKNTAPRPGQTFIVKVSDYEKYASIYYRLILSRLNHGSFSANCAIHPALNINPRPLVFINSLLKSVIRSHARWSASGFTSSTSPLSFSLYRCILRNRAGVGIWKELCHQQLGIRQQIIKVTLGIPTDSIGCLLAFT